VKPPSGELEMPQPPPRFKPQLVTHWPPAQLSPAGQGAPQAPQLALSVWTLAQ